MSAVSIQFYINKIRKAKPGKAKWAALKKVKLVGSKTTLLFVGKHLLPAPLCMFLPFFVPSPFFSLALCCVGDLVLFPRPIMQTCTLHMVLMTATKIVSDPQTQCYFLGLIPSCATVTHRVILHRFWNILSGFCPSGPSVCPVSSSCCTFCSATLTA